MLNLTAADVNCAVAVPALTRAKDSPGVQGITMFRLVGNGKKPRQNVKIIAFRVLSVFAEVFTSGLHKEIGIKIVCR